MKESRWIHHAAGTALALASLAGASAWAAPTTGVFAMAGGSAVVPSASSQPVLGIAGSGVDVGSDVKPSFVLGYRFTPHLAVELLGAWPFQHDIKGAGTISSLGTVGSVKQLPPTLTIDYFFRPGKRVQPYVGAGINRTMFFDEQTRGALAGDSLSLDNTWGVAAQAGVQITVMPKTFVAVDLRYIDIRTTAHLRTSSGTSNFNVSVDPFVYSLSIGRYF